MSPKCCHLAPMAPLAPPHHHKAWPGTHHALIYEHIGPCNCFTTVCVPTCSCGLYKQSIDGTMKYGNAHLNRLWRVCNLIDKSSSLVRFSVHWISDDCCQNSGRKSALQAHRERAGPRLERSVAENYQSSYNVEKLLVFYTWCWKYTWPSVLSSLSTALSLCVCVSCSNFNS